MNSEAHSETSWTYGNGATDAHTFDFDYRMTSVKDVGTGNVQYLEKRGTPFTRASPFHLR